MSSFDRPRIATAHELYARGQREHDLDAAYSAASVLSFLDAESVEHRALLRELDARPSPRPVGRVDAALVRHPDQDPRVDDLLSIMAPALAAWQAKERPASVSITDPRTVDQEHEEFVQTVEWASSALGVELPELSLRPDDDGGLMMMSSKHDGRVHPLLIVFGDALRSGGGDLVFDLTRSLGQLWPAHYAFLCIDNSRRNLDAVLSAYRVRARSVAELQADQQEIIGQIDERLSPRGRQLLEERAQQLFSTQDVDAEVWTRGAELTRQQVALLLSGDLSQAALAEGASVDVLLDYLLSPRYLEARRRLGLQLQP